MNARRIRVLYSFPHKIGAARICSTAWHQVDGLAAAGADVTVFPASMARPLPPRVKLSPTLAAGKLRLPVRLLGRMAFTALHDWIVSRRIQKMPGQFDVIHVWPLGALRTLRTANAQGVPTFLERPNAYTGFAYRVVQDECERLGVKLPSGHEHSCNMDLLRHEEEEYALAGHLLCPSDFVARTFRESGFPENKLARHQYGFDETIFQPGSQSAPPGRGLTMLFVGGCAPRKGLHYALEAWLKSSAHKTGTFLIAGDFVPGYAEKLASQLAHPSVQQLGHRGDVAALMRKSDLLVLPTIEEGSALATYEARGCGCVLLVSDASGAVCRHEENALVHPARDVATLADHITRLDQDRSLLARLRSQSLRTAHQLTWKAAGEVLLNAYRAGIACARGKCSPAAATV